MGDCCGLARIRAVILARSGDNHAMLVPPPRVPASSRRFALARPLACSLIPFFLAACQPKVAVNLGFGGGKIKEVAVLDSGESSKVAVIEVRGLIADFNRPTLLGPGVNVVDRFVAELELARKDPAVKAVVLRLNSPGGTVTASDTMYRELRRFREESGKPVVASMSEVAASGAYYLALGADTIYAQPTTITASIGVIFPTLNFSEGLAKIGVHSRSITSGPNKDIANPLEPMRDGQYAILQGMVDEYYATFKALVIERRHLNPDVITQATDGRIVTGKQAKAWGLVDENGGLREAFEDAKRRAGLDRARLVKYVEEGKPVQSPYASAGDALPKVETNFVQINMPELNALGMTGAGAYYLWMP